MKKVAFFVENRVDLGVGFFSTHANKIIFATSEG